MKKIIGITLIVGSLIVAMSLLAPDKSITANTKSETAPKVIASLSESLPASTIPERMVTTTPPPSNITTQVGQQIAEEFLKKNPNGPDLLSGEKFVNTIEPEKLVEDLVAGKLGDEALADFNPIITAAELNLSTDKTPEAVRAYLETFNQVIQNNASGLSVDFNNPTADDFNRIAKVGEKTIAAFYAMPVPQTAINLHKEELRLLTIQRNIFRNIANYESDPLRAWVSIEMYRQNSKEFEDLKEKIANFVKANNLGA